MGFNRDLRLPWKIRRPIHPWGKREREEKERDEMVHRDS